MADEQSMARRKFLAAAGSGMAALAGCSRSDTGSPTQEPVGQDTASPTSTATQDPTDTSTSTPSETTASVQDNVTKGEEELQNYLTEDYGNWVEVRPEDVEVPSSAKDGEDVELNQSDAPFGYEDLVNAYRNPYAASEAEPGNSMIGFSGEDGSGYRTVALASDFGEWTLNENEKQFESEAVERFLRENVHGYVDHAEGMDEALLETARQ